MSLTKIEQKSKTLIFFSAYTQFENLGDLLITRTLFRLLRKHGQLVIDTRSVPDSFIKQLEIAEHEKASQNIKFRALMLLASLKALTQPNRKIYFVVNPGHHYGKGMPFVSLVKTYFYLNILKHLNVRICRFGASIGPFEGNAKVAEKLIGDLMYFYSVRDSISEKYAHSLRIKSVHKFPDLAWMMREATLPTDKSIDRDYVIFSFRSSTYSSNDDDKNYFESLVEKLDEIAKTVYFDWKQRIVICYQVGTDKKMCEQLWQRYRTQYDIEFIETCLDVEQMREVYSGASMIFSNRLHVLLFGMVHGAIAIATLDESEHSKITGIFSDNDLDKFIIDIRGNQVSEVLDQVAAHKHECREKIASCFVKQAKLGEAILSEVMD